MHPNFPDMIKLKMMPNNYYLAISYCIDKRQYDIIRMLCKGKFSPAAPLVAAGTMHTKPGPGYIL